MTSPTPWRLLTEADLAALTELAERARAADGGHPMATTEAFLRSRFLDSASHAAFADQRLNAAVGIRTVNDSLAATGLVDPAARTVGLGSALVDWALSAGATRFETEGLTEEADALLRANGLHQTFAEDVNAYDLSHGAPANEIEAELRTWTDELAPRFFAVYEASFRDRPGFPGWSQREWTRWLADDDDFAPEWTLLASRHGIDIGFIGCASGAWVVQVGVVPDQRGTGLGGALTAEALRRMSAGGERVCFLDVNTNNPGAIRVYARLGFTRIGRRARYEKA
jgi:mycothiol synthase